MYIPKSFAAPSAAAMHTLMRAHPLGALVTLAQAGLVANHIPMQLLADAGPHGVLRAHVARANPLVRDLQAADALVIFQGPQAYVSPLWYPSKQLTGKAVPTWNYMVVHAHGPLRIVEEAQWLRAQLEALTATHEAGKAQPWSMDDAPQDYIATMMNAIVGIEIPIARLEGKWKLSQNQPPPNRDGVIAGLAALGDAGALAVADHMQALQP
jgi:transcriptional regulator